MRVPSFLKKNMSTLPKNMRSKIEVTLISPRGVPDSNLGWLQNVVEHASKHEYYLALARVSGRDQALRDVYFHATSSQKV